MSTVLLARLLLVAAMGTWMFAACWSSDGDARVDDDDAGTTRELSTGEKMAVALDGNPTTGYSWYVADVDETILRQVGETEFDPDSDAEGAAGTVTLRFEAIAPGSTPLHLVYRRENEDDAAAAQTWQITVEVEE